MKKALIVLAAVIVLVCGGLVIYLNTDSYQQKASHLPEDTTINGIDCSGMTKDEAESALQKKWDKNTFIVKKKGRTAASFPLKGLSYETGKKIDEIIGTNFFEVIKNHMGSSRKEYTVAMKIKDSGSFDKKVLKDDFLDIPYKVKTKDAYINMDNTDFKVIKEVCGDNVDKHMVLEKIKKLIAKGEFGLNFKKSDFIDVPDIKKGDKVLKEERKFDKENYSQKFIYEKYNGEYRITPGDIKKMRPVDKDGTARVNKKAIKKYMSDVLAWKVNTQYFNRKFKSTDQGTITVYGGTYGYVLDKEKEAKKLAEDLEANKDFSRRPVFSQEPYFNGKGKSDIGDSYAEVSIASQSLWLYIKGKCVLSTSVTTGKAGHDTEMGVYYIEYKQLNATLTGQDYSSKVSYWMPFNGNQGCHDAPWRGDFGSSGYVTDGSHGCVNMPYYAAADMYSKVEKGFPIVVH